MPRSRATSPMPMERVAIVALAARRHRVLASVASEGCVAFDDAAAPNGPAAAALQRVRARANEPFEPVASLEPVDVAALEAALDVAALAGEAEIERIGSLGVVEGPLVAWAGWTPRARLERLAERLEHVGAGVVPLRRPRGVEPPTELLETGAATAFQPLVNTYGTVPYADLNPSLAAGLAYVVMFGMMFGDAGHGLLLLGAGVLLALAREGRFSRLARFHWAWPFVVGAAVASIGFGLAYGEAFGPTGLVPTLWLRPLDHATTLLAVAVLVGGIFLALSYALGTVNRYREGGIARTLVTFSGAAGFALYLGLALIGAGWYVHRGALLLAGLILATVALAVGFWGLYVATPGRGSGVLEAAVELFDSVLRLGTNTISFARLAAFGLTHAALCALVWDGTLGLWRRGALGAVGAVVVFVVGNALTFALEALVAGIQALRLEYYEIFSRVFVGEGRPFAPWHVALSSDAPGPLTPHASPISSHKEEA